MRLLDGRSPGDEANRRLGALSTDNVFVHEVLRAAKVERLYEPLFAVPL
jgi:hypothetical protein